MPSFVKIVAEDLASGQHADESSCSLHDCVFSGLIQIGAAE